MFNSDIFFDNSNLNKNKLRKNWVIKNYPEDYLKIEEFSVNSKLGNLKFSNIIYNYLNNITSIPKCDICNKDNKRFIGFKRGYDDYCSKRCALAASREGALRVRKNNTLKKHGVEHTSQLECVKEKQALTNFKKYGVKSPTQNLKIKNKQESTMLEKYGVRFTGQSEALMDKVFKTRFDKYKREIEQTYSDLDIVKINSVGELKIKCDKCGEVYNIKTTLLRLRHFRYKINPCLICNPIKSYNYSAENKLYEFLKDLNLNIIRNDRKILEGKEIDILLPDYNIAIEFNGLYWHSELYLDKKYHLDKKVECEEKEINLIHIWEDDWVYKEDIVKSRIINLLRLSEKIWARRCKVVEVSSVKSREFLNKNHLQGAINSSYRIGLEFNGELVSLMTFGKYRRSLGKASESDKWELYRFCNKLNTNVVGSFSRLLKHFENDVNPHIITTYANRDWSVSENIYSKFGFDFKHETDVNYWYFSGEIKRQHRFNFRKDKLVKRGFDKKKTESEIMRDLGYLKIYDCGSLKYEKYFGN